MLAHIARSCSCRVPHRSPGPRRRMPPDTSCHMACLYVQWLLTHKIPVRRNPTGCIALTLSTCQRTLSSEVAHIGCRCMCGGHRSGHCYSHQYHRSSLRSRPDSHHRRACTVRRHMLGCLCCMSHPLLHSMSATHLHIPRTVSCTKSLHKMAVWSR